MTHYNAPLPAYPDNTAHQMWLAENELTLPKRKLFPLDSVYMFGWCSCLMVVSKYQDIDQILSALMLGSIIPLWRLIAISLLYRKVRARFFDDDYQTVIKMCRKTRELRWAPFNEVFYSMLLARLDVHAHTYLGQAVEAQQILRLHSSDWSDAQRMTRMAEIYLVTGNIVRAEALYTTVYNIVQSSGTATYIEKTLACTNMASVMLAKNDGVTALKYAETALSLLGIESDATTRTLLVHTLRVKARALIRLNREDEGDQMLETAKQTSERLKERAGVTWCLSEAELQLAYAELRLQQNRLQEALLHAQCAIDLYGSKTHPGHSMSVYAHRLLATILCRLNREPESMEVLSKSEMGQNKLIEDNEARVSMIRARYRLTSD